MQNTSQSDGDVGDSPVNRYVLDRGNGVRLEVYVEGAGDLVVLLPSLGRGAEDLAEISKPIAAAGYRVLRPEPRGNAGSVGPMEGKTLHDWAQDICAVIESQASGPAFVVGHAHGNWIARTVASDRPDLVKALVLLAGSAGKVPKGVSAKPISDEIRSRIEICGNMTLPKEKRLENLKMVFFAPGNDARVWLDGWNENLMVMQTLAQKRTPVEEFFAGGVAPILNIQARHDVIAPQHFSTVLSDYLGERVMNVTIDNAAHALLPEQPEAVIHEILKYFEKCKAHIVRSAI